MRAVRALLGAVLVTVVLVAPASAHVVLVTSSPVAGASLSSAPTEVSITFDNELDPDLSSFRVTGPGSVEVGSGEVDLTVADRNVMRGPVTITAPGVYTVAYQVAGVDGHELEGTFSFGYQVGTMVIPGPTSNEGPDTAMSEPQPRTGLILLGALVLLASATVTFRRLGRL